jgi:16S rRNA processing protein RimM
MTARVCIAQIGAAHGVRGEVRLWTFTAEPTAVLDYGDIETEDGRPLVIEAMRPGKEFFVARLKGVSDRNAAEALRNVRLFVPRDRLPAPEADEFYHADLIGLEAVATDGRAIGKVTAVHNFGAGDLLEVKTGSETILLPFTQAAVPEIDLAGGRVVIDPPEMTGSDQPDSTS